MGTCGARHECPLGRFAWARNDAFPTELLAVGVVVHRRRWPGDDTEVRAKVGERTSSMVVLAYGTSKDEWTAVLLDLFAELVL